MKRVFCNIAWDSSFLLFVVMLSIFVVAISPLFAEVSPAFCESGAEERRMSSARALDAIENHYRMAEWYYLKYWETLYHPLWQARQNQREILSEKVRAEADVLYGRYLHFSESYLEIAREEWRELLKQLATLRLNVEAFLPVCPASSYQNCIEPRVQDLLTLTRSVREWLRGNNEWNENFSTGILKTLEESAGDHDRFEFRFQTELEDKRSKMSPVLLRHLRVLREKLEFQWPGNECCESCVPENLIGPADPVFQIVKIDYQGHKGVSGKVSNPADLVNAFEDFELQKDIKNQPRRDS